MHISLEPVPTNALVHIAPDGTEISKPPEGPFEQAWNTLSSLYSPTALSEVQQWKLTDLLNRFYFAKSEIEVLVDLLTRISQSQFLLSPPTGNLIQTQGNFLHVKLNQIKEICSFLQAKQSCLSAKLQAENSLVFTDFYSLRHSRWILQKDKNGYFVDVGLGSKFPMIVQIGEDGSLKVPSNVRNKRLYILGQDKNEEKIMKASSLCERLDELHENALDCFLYKTILGDLQEDNEPFILDDIVTIPSLSISMVLTDLPPPFVSKLSIPLLNQMRDALLCNEKPLAFLAHHLLCKKVREILDNPIKLHRVDKYRSVFVGVDYRIVIDNTAILYANTSFTQECKTLQQLANLISNKEA